jgi:PPM family protein phosphatase
MSTFQLTYGLATTKGLERKVNQDSAIALTWSDIPRFSEQNVGLFIVADGMGTPDEGLRASQVAIQIVSEEITADIFHQSEVSINIIMTAAVQKANRQVIADAANGGAGATITAALLISNQLYIAHVGDNRLYYVEDEMISQMTNDHAYITLGRVLYRALGQSETVEVDFRSEQVAPNSQLLLCTDGLIASDSRLTEADILPVVVKNEPQIACDQLIGLAQKHGSTDDITVIMIKLSQ